MNPTIEMLRSKGCRRLTPTVWEYGPVGASYTIVIGESSIRVLSPTGRWRTMGV